MNLFRRLWNLARVLLRPRKPIGATEPEPPSVEDLRADIRVRLAVDEALDDLAGWRLQPVESSIDDIVIRNFPVDIVWRWVDEEWSHVLINGHYVPYMPKTRKIERAMKAARAHMDAECLRAAAEAVGGKL